ncbi:MAG: DUF447 family protein [Pirellulales bacterium]|nr:DUF447 family protein [Pirellulales bacterium]
MILEGIVTTTNTDGSINVAPMGPFVESFPFARLRLRPFQTSTSYANLLRTRAGVFHVVDDVELLVRAALGLWEHPPAFQATPVAAGAVLTDACRWYAFTVTKIDDRPPRADMEAEVTAQGTLHEFAGFNRAKHAIVEACILATRIEILPAGQIRDELARLTLPVEKTAGRQELRAWALLHDFFAAKLG